MFRLRLDAARVRFQEGRWPEKDLLLTGQPGPQQHPNLKALESVDFLALKPGSNAEGISAHLSNTIFYTESEIRDLSGCDNVRAASVEPRRVGTRPPAWPC